MLGEDRLVATAGNGRFERGEIMGLFDGLFGEQKNADPMLSARLAAPIESYRSKQNVAAQRALARESDAIMAILQNTGETCLVVAHSNGFGYTSVAVVTDRRTFTIHRGKIKEELNHEDVAHTTIKEHPSDVLIIEVRSRKSRLEYPPENPMHYDNVMYLYVAAPSIARSICREIDSRLNT